MINEQYEHKGMYRITDGEPLDLADVNRNGLRISALAGVASMYDLDKNGVDRDKIAQLAAAIVLQEEGTLLDRL